MRTWYYNRTIGRTTMAANPYSISFDNRVSSAWYGVGVSTVLFASFAFLLNSDPLTPPDPPRIDSSLRLSFYFVRPPVSLQTHPYLRTRPYGASSGNSVKRSQRKAKNLRHLFHVITPAPTSGSGFNLPLPEMALNTTETLRTKAIGLLPGGIYHLSGERISGD